ncbi:DNA break repair nuclease [Sorochytrium milnesiophthora]
MVAIRFRQPLCAYPSVAIDSFVAGDPGVEVLILTHTHSDHTQGLECIRNKPIFCSPVTHALLRSARKVDDQGVQRAMFPSAAAAARPLELYVEQRVQASDGELSITLLDAHHCPGAVMVLLSGPNGTVLHTGDFRADAEFWNDTRLTEMLQRVPVDTVYLDTTFCRSGCPHFPSRDEACRVLVEVLQRYSFDRVFTMRLMLGHERIIETLHYACGFRIHVTPSVYNTYKQIPMYTRPNAMLATICSTNQQLLRMGRVIHVCGRDCSEQHPREWIHLKPCAQHFYHLSRSSRRTSMRYERLHEHATLTKRPPKPQPDDTDQRLKPDVLRICFSCHSSRHELGRFLKWLQPQSAVSTVASAAAEWRDFRDLACAVNVRPRLALSAEDALSGLERQLLYAVESKEQGISSQEQAVLARLTADIEAGVTGATRSPEQSLADEPTQTSVWTAKEVEVVGEMYCELVQVSVAPEGVLVAVLLRTDCSTTICLREATATRLLIQGELAYSDESVQRSWWITVLKTGWVDGARLLLDAGVAHLPCISERRRHDEIDFGGTMYHNELDTLDISVEMLQVLYNNTLTFTWSDNEDCWLSWRSHFMNTTFKLVARLPDESPRRLPMLQGLWSRVPLNTKYELLHTIVDRGDLATLQQLGWSSGDELMHWHAITRNEVGKLQNGRILDWLLNACHVRLDCRELAKHAIANDNVPAFAFLYEQLTRRDIGNL